MPGSLYVRVRVGFGEHSPIFSLVHLSFPPFQPVRVPRRVGASAARRCRPSKRRNRWREPCQRKSCKKPPHGLDRSVLQVCSMQTVSQTKHRRCVYLRRSLYRARLFHLACKSKRFDAGARGRLPLQCHTQLRLNSHSHPAGRSPRIVTWPDHNV